MTTVSYGDITPKTTEGKEVAVTVMLVGIGFATLLIGAVAERFFHREIEDVELTEEDVLAQVRGISAQLQRLERALEQRR
jgi:voltage-gated potassium channel